MAADALQAQLAQGASPTVQMDPTHEVNANAWEELGSLLNKKTWPRHPRRAREMYQSIRRREQNWPERLQALDRGYVLVDPNFEPSASTEL